MPKPTCSVATCESPNHAHSLCLVHYSRWRRHGDPEIRGRIVGDDTARFWSKVSGQDPLGCWLWAGEKNSDGYGQIRIAGKTLKAHRVAWELMRGPIPSGLQLDHLCRVRSCVNPEHLEPVTQLVNVRRGARTMDEACTKGHSRTVESTGFEKKTGRRYCKICRGAYFKRWKAMKQAHGS